MTLRTQLAEFDSPIARVLSWAVRRVPLESRDDALQEARLRYWRVAGRFDDAQGASLQTYMQQHVTGAVKDFCRSQDPLSRRQRQKVRGGSAAKVTQVGLVALDWTPNAGKSPEYLAIAAEAHRLIGLASGKGRTVLTIMCADDKNLSETAAELGMTPERTSQYREKALRQIRRKIRLALRIRVP
jgi:RNA polymerase sigma factor (sigma-70 family)